jgi:hypothetical protein
MADDVIVAINRAIPKTTNGSYSFPAACKPKPIAAPIPAMTMNIKAGNDPFVLI